MGGTSTGEKNMSTELFARGLNSERSRLERLQMSLEFAKANIDADCRTLWVYAVERRIRSANAHEAWIEKIERTV